MRITRLGVQAALLVAFAAYTTQKLVRSHLDPNVRDITYTFERDLDARKGGIFDAKDYALVRSIPLWNYHLDPVDLTNRVVRPGRHEQPRTCKAIVRTIATALDLDYRKVLAMAMDTEKRYQPLGRSYDADAHRILSDSKLVAGIAIDDDQKRLYLHGSLMSHVVGPVGLAGKYAKYMDGMPGRIVGVRDARGHELYDRRRISIEPKAGANIYLTLDHNLQALTEKWLEFGITNFSAGTGWAMIMDAKSAAVLAMASYPDYDPMNYEKADESARLNRCVGMVYEPGSVMKVITAASCFDAGFCRPGTLYSTAQRDERYYRLPTDGSHVWEPLMSVSNAIVHSSNIVIGKLGYDFGPERLHGYMQKFGFGARTGIELAGEEVGILPPWRKWDKASWSRAPIGQYVAVTPIQLLSAYQAIANDGVRKEPHIIRRIESPSGELLYEHHDRTLSVPIQPAAARAIRTVMRGVATREGTARRAAIKGYSVSGKTGTAQKSAGRAGYLPGQYRATFCGMVPSDNPAILVLVTLDFDRKVENHQGGQSSAVVFRHIAEETLRYLMVPSDRPEEIEYDPIDFEAE